MERFQLIAPFLKPYTRRFSLLDLGANECGLSGMIAREFDVMVTAIEQNPVEPPVLPNFMLLRHKITVEELERLNECEHFDVVLALNFLHHCGSDWERMAETTLRLGQKVFVQLPEPGDNSCGQDIIPMLTEFITSRMALLGKVHQRADLTDHAKRPLWVRENGEEKVLTRTSLNSEPASPPTTVTSNYNRLWRRAPHKRNPERDWMPGINLWNFCQLGGVWPTKEKVIRMLEEYPLPYLRHGDITPWNFVLDGSSVRLIDGFEGWGGEDTTHMRWTIEKVRETL